MSTPTAAPSNADLRPRPWLLLVVIALLGAIIVASLSSSEPFSERLVRVETERALPSVAPLLEEETAELNLLFLNYAPDPELWMSASLAVLQHGDPARAVLAEYGMVEEFQQVLTRYGSDAVLPIHYFHSNDVGTLRARTWVGERLDAVKGWFGDEDAAPAQELTPQRRGLFAIAVLQQHGHGFLDQFARSPDGEVIWLQGERVVSVVGDFFTSGLRDLESQWRQGQDIGVGDVGWAGLDLLVMAGSFKLLRAGKGVSMSRTGRAVGQGRIATSARFSSLGNAAKLTAVVGLGYVTLRHPGLISAAGTSLANWLGWPEWVGQFLVWFVVLLPLLYLLRFVVSWLIVPCWRLTAPVVRACARAVSGPSEPARNTRAPARMPPSFGNEATSSPPTSSLSFRANE